MKRPTAALLVCLSLPSAARAVDTITLPHPCVEHLHREVAGLDAHVVTVDMNCGEVDVVATRPRDRLAPVSVFAREYHAQIAINANFFEASTCGLAMGERVLWRSAYDLGCHASFAFGPSPHGTRAALIDSTHAVWRSPVGWAWNIVTGRPALLHDGATVLDSDEPLGMYRTHPRTALGTTHGGTSLVMVVIDGRRAQLPGVTSLEMIPLLEEFGVSDAINLDGGGSSELWIEGEGGIVNRPSDHHERSVVNHLGIRITSAR